MNNHIKNKNAKKNFLLNFRIKSLIHQIDLNVNNEIKESIKHENGITDGQKIQESFDAKDLIIKYSGLEDYVASVNRFGFNPTTTLECNYVHVK